MMGVNIVPNWYPNRNPVQWDWGAADAAMHALRQAADKLDESATTRTRLAGEAQAEWRGRHRETFDEQLHKLVSQARLLASEFRSMADRISYASHQAYDEKLHRESEVRRWENEKRDEERREAERRERERRGERERRNSR